MAENHVLLETIQLTQSAASITLDNIPQTGYTDLKIVGSVRSDYSGQAIALRINPNGSTANMASRVILGNGSYGSPSSFSDTIAYASAVADTSTANTYNNVEWYIPNYTSSSNKPISVDFVTETNAAAAIMGLSGGIWSVSSAITSLVIQTTAGNLMSGSTFSLYGVAAVGTTPVTAPKADGGNIVANDGTYWYHAFLTSGTFTPQTPLTADVLVIAGGGGGAGDVGGGAGAGGVLYAASKSLTASSYTCTIGAGGVGGVQGGTDPGTNGNDSYFDVLKAFGGGKGAVYSTAGNSGGSGSGCGGGNTGSGGAVTQTSNNGGIGYGNIGGSTVGTSGTAIAGGGGGGAGAAGGNNSGGNGGNGGAGLNTWSAWASATNTGVSGYFAGGGGAGGWSATPGAGGAGGGGAGGQRSSGPDGAAGVANTGGGGGSDGGGGGVGGAGGSGIVLIRYAMA